MAITAFYLRAFALLGKTDVLAASRHSDLDLGLTCRLFVIKTGDEAFFVSRGNRHSWRYLFTWKSDSLMTFAHLCLWFLYLWGWCLSTKTFSFIIC